VEGWVITRFGIVTEHGWVEYNGEVVDPTPTYVDCDVTKYFPGVKYTLEEMSRLASKRGATVPFVHGKLYHHGMENSAYRTAYRDAYRALLGDQAGFILDHLYKVYPDLKEEGK
jgi:hypothetical protein